MSSGDSVSMPLRTGRLKLGVLALCAVLSLAAWWLLERTLQQGISPHYLTALSAARSMQNALQVIRREKQSLGLLQDRELDPNRTGVIGPELTPLVTTLGHLPSKRTASNPDLAAALVKVMQGQGLGPGSQVVMVLSGSFVGGNIAAVAAADALGLDAMIINSAGGSMYGAVDPELTWLDMHALLLKEGVVRTAGAFAVPGGYDGIATSMDEAGVSAIRESAERSGIELLEAESLSELVDLARGRLLARFGDLAEIDMIVNVGGAMLGLGNCLELAGLRDVITAQPIRCVQGQPGLVSLLSEAGVPVLNVLNMRFLALDLGLPYDPIPLPSPGNNRRVYRTGRVLRRNGASGRKRGSGVVAVRYARCMTTFEELRAHCLAKRGVREELPFDLVTPVWKVGGKMFALSGLRDDPPRVNLKGDPEENEVLRAAYEAILPGWHMNKRHWNTVVLDGSLPDDLIRELIDRSYELVVAKLPKRVREELEG